MDDLAAEIGDELAQPPPHGDDFLADFYADLLDHAHDVALLRRGFGADDEVGAAQDVDVQGVVFQHEGVIDQLADLAAAEARLDLVQVVQGLGGGHVMGGGADTADAAGDLRHVLGRSAEAEHLEAAQLGHLQVGAFDVALVVEEDVDLAVAFEAGDGIDGERRRPRLVGGVGAEVALVEGCLGQRVHITLHWRGQIHFAAQHALGEAVAVEGADRVRDAAEHLVDVAFFLRRDVGAEGGHDLEALVAHARGGAEATGAGHVAGGALRLAAAAGRRPHADDALRQEAQLGVDQQSGAGV